MITTTSTAVETKTRILTPTRIAQLGLAAAAITSSALFSTQPAPVWSSTSVTVQRHASRMPFADFTSASVHSAASPEVKLEQSTPVNSVFHLREISDLTAEQLARLFGVSRRSVQSWIGGAPMAAVHEERLSRLTAVIGAVGNTPDERRQRLLSSPGRMSLFHQLITELDEEEILDPSVVSVRDKLRV